ncbi:MAG: nucleoside triphosphate pyrophosphohydrolase [Deltaproteobacteria bacterium]|nr:nucleoside triphosphate pyrophosphohydrolase [Deltaproteobacteria bacterium]
MNDASKNPNDQKQVQASDLPDLVAFIETVRRLRAPGGCPWDREQTHQSLRSYLLEETHEVLEAIDNNDTPHLREELGDLLLQVILHAQLATDAKQFNINDVANEINQKMIRRHPHVFGDKSVSGSGEVLKNWEEIKKKEKQDQGKQIHSLLDGIPNGLPALFEAWKMSKKAAKTGFDWSDVSGIFEKMNEELDEVKEAIAQNDNDKIEEEIGDLLFTVANIARFKKINPELALQKANRKFKSRFQSMEESARSKNINLETLSPTQWEELWQHAKDQ